MSHAWWAIPSWAVDPQDQRMEIGPEPISTWDSDFLQPWQTKDTHISRHIFPEALTHLMAKWGKGEQWNNALSQNAPFSSEYLDVHSYTHIKMALGELLTDESASW